LQLPQRPEVFVLGDAAYLANGDGQPLPMLSTVAIQQGKVTARSIQRIIEGKKPEPFHYKDPGLLATIGRNAAVAHIWDVSFSGFIAWVIWVFLHIYRLIGFRNCILVFVNWAWGLSLLRESDQVDYERIKAYRVNRLPAFSSPYIQPLYFASNSFAKHPPCRVA